MQKMRFTSLVLLVLFVVALVFADLPTVANAQEGDTCADGLTSQLRVGMSGRVTFTDGTPTNLRKQPTSPVIVVAMPEGHEFTVIGGPTCDNNLYWWQLETEDGLTGWAAEGRDEIYWIEPLPAAGNLPGRENATATPQIPVVVTPQNPPYTGTIRFTRMVQASCTIELLSTWAWTENDLATFQAAASEPAEQILEAVFTALVEAADEGQSLPSRLVIRDMQDKDTGQFVTDVTWGAGNNEMVIETLLSPRAIELCEAFESLD